MSKKISNKTVKMTNRKALSCVIATALVLTSGVAMFNKFEISSSAVASSGQDVNQKDKILIDSKEKAFFNLELAKKAVEFDFKVPQYIMSDNFVDMIYVNNTASDNRAVKIEYRNNNEEKFTDRVNLYVFKGSAPEDALKTLTNLDNVESKELTLGSINGKELTMTSVCNDDEKTVMTHKEFLWEDNGVWYAIEFEDRVETPGEEPYVLKDVSQVEVQKIAESLVDASNADKGKYTIDGNGINIYTEGDLKYAAKKLEFEPKLFTDIDEELSINNASVDELHNDDFTPTGKYILTANYTYNNKDASLYVEKLDDESSNLESFTKSLVELQGGKDFEKVEGSDVEAYKYEIATDIQGQTILNYVWNKDGANYRIVIYNGKIDEADYSLGLKIINTK